MQQAFQRKLISTVQSMLEQRGYQSISPPIPSSTSSTPTNAPKLLLQAINPARSERVYVWLVNYHTQKIDELTFTWAFESASKDLPFVRCLWIEDQPSISKGLDKFVEHYKSSYPKAFHQIERWSTSELVRNLHRHVIFRRIGPELITNPFASPYLESKQKEWELFPRIVVTDPIARYLGGRPGEFICFHRRDLDTGQAPYYRLIIREPSARAELLTRDAIDQTYSPEQPIKHKRKTMSNEQEEKEEQKEGLTTTVPPSKRAKF